MKLTGYQCHNKQEVRTVQGSVSGRKLGESPIDRDYAKLSLGLDFKAWEYELWKRFVGQGSIGSTGG